MSLEREHHAHDRGKRHGSRQRAANWLFESRPTRAHLHAAQRLLGSDNVRILNQSHEIPEGICNRSHPNTLPHVSHGRCELRPSLNKVLNSLVGVRHPPVRHRAARPGLDALDIGVQSELKAANVEADVKWLVKIRRDAEGGAVPLLGAWQVGDMIDHGAKQWYSTAK